MKKIILAFLCFINLKAFNLNEPIITSFEVVESNIIKFPAFDLRVGETGFIKHKFGDIYKSLIQSAEIIEINDGMAKARILNSAPLTQRLLPTPTASPQNGDEIVFRILNNQAFLIAPDFETYQNALLNFSDEVTFLNPDLMAGYLFDVGGFDPKPKFLNRACDAYSVGLLYIITKDSINILDCQSLITLETREFNTQNVEKTIAPFFSRIQYDSSGSLDSSLRKKLSKNYFAYYESLVKEGKNFKAKKD